MNDDDRSPDAGLRERECSTGRDSGSEMSREHITGR